MNGSWCESNLMAACLGTHRRQDSVVLEVFFGSALGCLFGLLAHEGEHFECPDLDGCHRGEVRGGNARIARIVDGLRLGLLLQLEHGVPHRDRARKLIVVRDARVVLVCVVVEERAPNAGRDAHRAAVARQPRLQTGCFGALLGRAAGCFL
jgi:hypothetical protein